MKKIILMIVFVLGTISFSNAQGYYNSRDTEQTYGVSAYSTFVNGFSAGVMVDIKFLGTYLDFGTEKSLDGIEGNKMAFGLMVEPLPGFHLMGGVASYDMYEDSQHFGYDFKFMYDVIPIKYSNLVLAPIMGINSKEITFGVALGIKVTE